MLHELSDDGNRDKALEAKAILYLIDVKFVFCLHIFYDILKQMQSASDTLQKVQFNISKACDLIQNDIQLL